MTSDFSPLTPCQRKPHCWDILDSPPALRIHPGSKESPPAYFNCYRHLKAFLPEGHLTTAYFGFDFCGVSFLLAAPGDAAGVAELAKPWSWAEGARGACAYRCRSVYFCFWVGSQQLVLIPIRMCLSQSLALFLCNIVTLRYSGTLLLTMAEMHSWRLERGCFSVQGHMFEWFQLGNPLSLVVWWSPGLLTFVKLCHPLQ